MRLTLSLLTILIWSFSFSHGADKCEHITVQSGAVGIKTIYVTMCLKYDSQVNKFNDHFESKRAEEYFK